MSIYHLHYWSPERSRLLPRDMEIAADGEMVLERFTEAGRRALGLYDEQPDAVPDAADPPDIAAARDHLREALRLLDDLGHHIGAATPARASGRLHLRYRG